MEHNEKPVILTTEQMIESAKESLKAIIEGNADTIIKQYESIAILGIDDVHGLKKADEARKILKKYRTSIEAKRKELKDVSIRYGKEIDNAAKLLSKPFEQRELEIEYMIENYEKAKKQEAEKAEKERIEKFNSRVESLFSLGFLMGKDGYVLGGLAKVSPERIQSATDEEWAGLIAKSKKLAEKQKAINDEAKRLHEANEAAKREEMSRTLNEQLSAPQKQRFQDPEVVQITYQEVQPEIVEVMTIESVQVPVLSKSGKAMMKSAFMAYDNHPDIAYNVFKRAWNEAVEFMKIEMVEALSNPDLKTRHAIIEHIKSL